MSAVRAVVIAAGLLVLWQIVVVLTGVAPFILPSPADVLAVWWLRLDLLLGHAAVTLAEMLLGLILGTAFGIGSALTMAHWRPARQWMMPVLVVSQAVPVFAIAPLLVLWFGYGLAPKILMASLIIYFPVTAAFHDGLRRTEPGWLDLAHTMGATKWAVLTQLRVPAALPALASGLRVAAAVAPIGAVVGEWVGASAGLGHYMLTMHGRTQTDAVFAALFTLAIMAVTLYFTIDWGLRRALPWQPDSDPGQAREDDP